MTGSLPPTTVTLYGPKAAATLPHRCPGPTLTTDASALMLTASRRDMSTRMPGWPMLAQPGLGEWPPLRIAKRT